MKSGVLAIQGDFDAHKKRLEQLGADVVLVRKPDQFDQIDGLVIPGGESGAFLKILGEGMERVPCRVLGLCLMPNHWHLVLWPHADGDLSRLMAWISNTHVKRYRQHYHDRIGGHLYQGRFKSFPVETDDHLYTLLRYVERNPLRAGLVRKATNWRWSSLGKRHAG